MLCFIEICSFNIIKIGDILNKDISIFLCLPCLGCAVNDEIEQSVAYIHIQSLEPKWVSYNSTECSYISDCLILNWTESQFSIYHSVLVKLLLLNPNWALQKTISVSLMDWHQRATVTDTTSLVANTGTKSLYSYDYPNYSQLRQNTVTSD